MSVTWVLEPNLMPAVHAGLRAAANEAGGRVVTWEDQWWSRGLPDLAGEFVVFHGSLENAARVVQSADWSPGAFCNVDAFACSAWYESAREFLVHERWEVLPAQALVDGAAAVFGRLGLDERAFVRPDSPLKPFSGRVVARDGLSLAALDHGFYYDDAELPVVVAPVQAVGKEWRYVVAGGQVIAGSAYLADGRKLLPDSPEGDAWRFAARVAEQVDAPDPIYVLDVCETDRGLRLLELNPFSGADLYACDPAAIVAAVDALRAAHA